MNTPTIDQLKRGLEIAEQIAALNAEMASILGNHSAPSPTIKTSAPAPVKRKKGKISAEGLARIIAAQKKRWAKVKAGKHAPAAANKPAPKKKGGITPAGRKKLALAMKKRWAAAKAGKGPAPTAK